MKVIQDTATTMAMARKVRRKNTTMETTSMFDSGERLLYRSAGGFFERSRLRLGLGFGFRLRPTPSHHGVQAELRSEAQVRVERIAQNETDASACIARRENVR